MLKEKYVVINISMPPAYVTRLREMATFRNLSISDTVRRALDIAHKEYVKERGGYFAGADSLGKRGKKEETQKIIDFLRSAEGPEVIAYLQQIGFLKPDEQREGFVVKWLFQGAGADRQLFTVHELPDGTHSYKATVYLNIDKMVEDMRKEKKL